MQRNSTHNTKYTQYTKLSEPVSLTLAEPKVKGEGHNS